MKFDYVSNTPLYKDYTDNNFIGAIINLCNYIFDELKEEPLKIEVDLIKKNVKVTYYERRN